MNQNQEKENAALAALDYIQHECILGVGSGSTVTILIQNLNKVKHNIKASVSSSEDTTNKLKQAGFEVDELSNVGSPDLYIDGADEVTRNFYMTKGGGGALTREKILAAASKKIICIVDSSKIVDVLGKYPLPIEVIPMAKPYISREIISDVNRWVSALASASLTLIPSKSMIAMYSRANTHPTISNNIISLRIIGG